MYVQWPGISVKIQTKLKKLFFEIENYKDKKTQSSKVIFSLDNESCNYQNTKRRIPDEEHKKKFLCKNS